MTAQASTSGQDADAVSVEASARVLRAFASAWVAAGHVESELIRLVVRASQGAPAQSWLPLLTALSAPLPSVSPSKQQPNLTLLPGHMLSSLMQGLACHLKFQSDATEHARWLSRFINGQVTALQSICIVLLELGVQSSKGDEGDEEPWLSTAADMVGKVCPNPPSNKSPVRQVCDSVQSPYGAHCSDEADDDLRLHVRLTSLMLIIVLKLHLCIVPHMKGDKYL